MRIGIVAHKTRQEMAYNLAKDVHADYISVDPGDLYAARNHRRVWGMLERVTGFDDWGIVLEDDAVPVPNFREQAQASLKVAPTQVVSFYLGRLRPPQFQDKVKQAVARADSVGAHWIKADATIHGVALAIKGELIGKMLYDTSHSPRPLDEAITQWCRKFQHDVAYCWPSLCNHADVPSVIGRHSDGAMRESGRVAYRLGTRERWDGRSVSW